MRPNDPRVDEIVALVVDRLKKQGAGGAVSAQAVAAALAGTAPAVRVRRRGVFDDVDSAVAAARKAFEQYEQMPLAARYGIVRAMRDAALGVLEEMCQRAVAETRLGRVEDKRLKNRAAITKTPGPEWLEPVAASGDDGLMITERAAYGVIASITPCTNPTETIINNGIGMVAGGNAVVFNTHPAAKETSAWYVSLLCDAIVAAGGPENLLCCIAEPTVASAQALMRHKGVRIVVVTGGGAVVSEAMRSGKRAISAGPGNPPAVVDETAHIEAAARGIVAGASFDNNIICTCEKEMVVVASVADKFKKALRDNATHELTAGELRQLEKVLITPTTTSTASSWAKTPTTSSAPSGGARPTTCVCSGPRWRSRTPSSSTRCSCPCWVWCA
jgi:acyl-CoA reductase-like NAD-dependent aldehyde dehydrogenase